MTKKFKMSRKIVALLVMAVMVMAMSMTAFASTTETKEVHIYRTDGTTTSMADAIVENDRTATVTTNDDKTVVVSFNIVPLYKFTMGIFTADGYLETLKVENGTAVVEKKSGDNYTEITGGEDPAVTYTNARVTIKLNSMPENYKINVTDSYIALFNVGSTTNRYFWNHVSQKFVIGLE